LRCTHIYDPARWGSPDTGTNPFQQVPAGDNSRRSSSAARWGTAGHHQPTPKRLAWISSFGPGSSTKEMTGPRPPPPAAAIPSCCFSLGAVGTPFAPPVWQRTLGWRGTTPALPAWAALVQSARRSCKDSTQSRDSRPTSMVLFEMKTFLSSEMKMMTKMRLLRFMMGKLCGHLA
jgi:hypothetical protein